MQISISIKILKNGIAKIVFNNIAFILFIFIKYTINEFG